MDLELHATFSLESAKSILEKLAVVKCYFAQVQSALSIGAFTDLHTTLQLENVDVADILPLFNINVTMLQGILRTGRSKQL